MEWAQGIKINRLERYLALGIALVLHAAALMFLILHRNHSVVPIDPHGTLDVISLTASAPARPPPPPTLPSRIIHETALKLQLRIASHADPGAPASATSGCTPLEEVRDSIIGDSVAIASALNSPPETKSIAEAVVIWNGDWIHAAGNATAPLAPARAAIERSVATMSQECLDEQIAGPRLIPLPASTGTLFLVFGSGTWKWQDVSDDIAITATARMRTLQPAAVSRAPGTVSERREHKHKSARR